MRTTQMMPVLPTRRIAPLIRRTAPRLESALAFVLPCLLYLALPAATINGDGLAYWARVRAGLWSEMFLPGHLLYLPLMSALNHVFQGLLPTDAVMRLANQLAGAGSVWLIYAAAGRLGISRFGQWLAAAVMALSFGPWIQAIDIESYALALLFVAASIYAMTRCLTERTLGWTAALGVCNSLAALFHLATITFGLTSVLFLVLLYRWQAFKHLAVYFAVSAACFGLPTCWIGFVCMELPSWAALFGWLRSSEHSYRVVFDWLSIPRALYGMARTLLVLESFWAGPKWLIALKGLGLMAAGSWLVWQWRVHRTRLTPMVRLVLGSLLAFVALQVFLGVYFFGSDSERWVFLTPFAALLLAAGVASWPAGPRWQTALGVALLAWVNLAQGTWVMATDRTAQLQVQALALHITDDTLVIGPGHDWLSQYSYYLPSAKPLQRVSLMGMALRFQDDQQGFYEALEGRIEQARQDGKQILMVRILDQADSSRECPWPEIAAFGLSPDSVRAWFRRYRWQELRLADPGQTRIHRLEGPAEGGIHD